MLHFTNDQITQEAMRLGLITDGEPLTQQHRSRAAAALAAAARTTSKDSATKPPVPNADSVLTVYAEGPVLLDGDPFPLFVAREPIEITARPDDVTTVRLTVVVGAAHLLPGAPDDEAPTS